MHQKCKAFFRETMDDAARLDSSLPKAMASLPCIEAIIAGRKPAFFLDFDGTLAPIASRPDLVTLPPKSVRVLQELGTRYLVCILSGRDLDDLKLRIGLPGLFYAGDHGFRIAGPLGSGIRHEVGAAALEALAAAAARLRDMLGGTAGVIIEEKGLSLSVHYRLAPPATVPAVEAAARSTHAEFPRLARTAGKMVIEFRPGEHWSKGHAVSWLVDRLGYGRDDVCPICMGDDITDEDAFRVIKGWGVSILVGAPGRPTLADYRLQDPDETAELLGYLAGKD
jgi:trehalose 6-phosphate phosphatase